MTLLVIASRFTHRAYQRRFWVRRETRYKTATRRAVIVGAGHTGVQVLDALEHTSDTVVVGFLDDNPGMAGTLVRGIKVLGETSQMSKAVQTYQANLVVIAMPSASGNTIRQIVATCHSLDVS